MCRVEGGHRVHVKCPPQSRISRTTSPGAPRQVVQAGVSGYGVMGPIGPSFYLRPRLLRHDVRIVALP